MEMEEPMNGPQALKVRERQSCGEECVENPCKSREPNKPRREDGEIEKKPSFFLISRRFNPIWQKAYFFFLIFSELAQKVLGAERSEYRILRTKKKRRKPMGCV